MVEVDNNQDVLDSRDVIARIDELEAEREGLECAVDEAQDQLDARRERLESEDRPVDVSDEERVLQNAKDEFADWDTSEEAEELKTLKALAEEAEGYAPDDWAYGATLIRDSYFEDYAREFAEEVGLTKGDCAWPYTCIDWAWAASELQMDYTSVDFDGVTYWVR